MALVAMPALAHDGGGGLLSVFHGHPHDGGMPVAGLWTGILAATFLLIGFGLLSGVVTRWRGKSRVPVLTRAGGGMLAMAGLLILAAGL